MDFEFSIVIPVYNEEDNVDPLMEQVFDVVQNIDASFEVITVDDGSRDRSFEKLVAWADKHENLRVIGLRRNYGQTAAMMAGIDAARGGAIISLDADLQNDPRDIPRMIEIYRSGYDVVSGWRKERKDSAVKRNLLSRIANRLISVLSGVQLHDYGCTLKIYDASMIKGVRLYGEMHRFIPIYADWMGARITEVEVNHHPRQHGKSKYGLERIYKVLLDLMVVLFLHRFLQKPIYIFGLVSLFSAVIAGASFVLMVYLKLFVGISMIQTPLPTLAATSLLFALLTLLMGLLAEIMVRTYYESQGLSTYLIGRTCNVEDRDHRDVRDLRRTR